MSNDTDKPATMKQYFACMDSADFVMAAGMFADDTVYLRPPFVPGQAAFASSGTQRIEGLPAIREFWDQRGKRNTHHVIKIESISGNEWFAEGEVSVDGSETRMFLSHVTFNGRGQVQRFVALR
jgi:SnoaL-like protein